MKDNSLTLPDPLIWQAGIEYGLEALADLPLGVWVCTLRDHGPMLEAAAFAVHQLGLQDYVRFQPRFGSRSGGSQIALFPRVAPLDHNLILDSLKRGNVVVTSDPSFAFDCSNLLIFPRRDSRTLRDILLYLLDRTSGLAEIGE